MIQTNYFEKIKKDLKIFGCFIFIFTFVLIMTTSTIENNQLKDISAKLKVHYPNWVAKVAEGISKEKEWKSWTNNPCTPENTRNISNGVIKGQMHRRLFMKVSAKMLLDVAQENKSITELVETISE